VESDKALNPIAIAPFGPQAVMLQSDHVPHSFQQLFGLVGGRFAVKTASIGAFYTGGSLKGKRIIQILSAFYCRFFRPNTR
jgi:hypothetical protein